MRGAGVLGSLLCLARSLALFLLSSFEHRVQASFPIDMVGSSWWAVVWKRQQGTAVHTVLCMDTTQ